MHKPAIICNHCGREFTGESDLAKLLETKEQSDRTAVVRYTGQRYDEEYAEVFNGCPDCMTDSGLMEIEKHEEAAT